MTIFWACAHWTREADRRVHPVPARIVPASLMVVPETWIWLARAGAPVMTSLPASTRAVVAGSGAAAVPDAANAAASTS